MMGRRSYAYLRYARSTYPRGEHLAPAPQSQAMTDALAKIGALPSRSDIFAKQQAGWDAGERPAHAFDGTAIPPDEDDAEQARRRAALERDLRDATWLTPAGEVEAARADLGRAS